MERTVTIDDTLSEILDRVQNNTKELLINYVKENPSRIKVNGKTLTPDIDQDLDYDGSIHQIVDQAVPIYYKEIKDLWYLYSQEFESAYKDSGVGDGKEDNHQQVAIFFFLDQSLRKWYDLNAKPITEKAIADLQRKNITKRLQQKANEKTLNLD